MHVDLLRYWEEIEVYVHEETGQPGTGSVRCGQSGTGSVRCAEATASFVFDNTYKFAENC